MDSAASPNVFVAILGKILLPAMSQVPVHDRKIVATGLIVLLFRSPVFTKEPYVALWPPTLEALIDLLETDDGVISNENEDDFDAFDITLQQGASTTFARLSFAKATGHDPVARFGPPRLFLVKSLSKEFSTLIQSISEKHKQALQKITVTAQKTATTK